MTTPAATRVIVSRTTLTTTFRESSPGRRENGGRVAAGPNEDYGVERRQILRHRAVHRAPLALRIGPLQILRDDNFDGVFSARTLECEMASDRVAIREKCTRHRRADDTHVRRVLIVTRRDRAARPYRNAHRVEATGADHEPIKRHPVLRKVHGAADRK